MDTNCGVSVNLSQLPSSTTPLHIVLWKGVDTATPTVSSTTSAPVSLENNETIKRLLDRISVLESMVSGLLETQKSSIWFSPGLRPTPTGIEVVSRRESMDAESDIGTVLSQLVRPTEVPIRITSPGGPEVREVKAVQVEATPREGLEEEAVEEAEATEATPREGLEEATEATPREGLEEEATEEAVEATEEGGEETEEEEQIVEYKEVEWKGQTYYVDDTQQAYEMDSDGDLIETPVGIWKEETQKLVRYKTA